jgi:hypothetical protein
MAPFSIKHNSKKALLNSEMVLNKILPPCPVCPVCPVCLSAGNVINGAPSFKTVQLFFFNN